MGEMNEQFKSQICTSIEQSQRLLDLGLKPETADCMYSVMTKSYNGRYILEEDRQYNLILFRQEEVQSVGFSHYEHIPAWSLHRLIEIAEVSVEVSGLFIRISSTYYYEEKDNVYDNLIDAISELINNEVFNKEYLKQ